MSLYDELNVKELLWKLQRVETTLEAFSAYSKYAVSFQDLKVVVSLDDFAAHKSFGKFETIAKIENVIPYYRSHQLLVLNNETVRAAKRDELANFVVDHTLMFDTNVASAISTMFRGRGLRNNHDRVIKLLDSVVYNEYNFDHLFYMQESIKFVRVISENWVGGAGGFWKKLNKGFRWNLAALMCFRKIECGEYVKHSKVSFECSFRQAVKEARNASYNYYVSGEGRDAARKVVLMQRDILLLLLVALRINFSTERNIEDRTKLLLDEVQSIVGVFHEREISILLSYFVDPKSVPILGTINKGGKNRRLLKKVDNIAWDFYTPRAMEMAINHFSTGQIILPYLATFDKNLEQLVGMFPVKGTILSVKDGLHLPFRSEKQVSYFEELGVAEIVAEFFTDQKIQERSRNRSQTIEEQFIKIKTEYEKFRSVMRA
ncbi:hypothetical protein KTQ74_06410 [Pseudomonas chlororaphis]|uniref:hypothetical protein n=1 Tax=Pseudomonas chlororaphis TaxID=587753 RepID=UPI001E3425A1|nr:hypothetical protein [Pseudomonas chlororaphis]MCB2251520.1 hypothetical protein [Pseudomonas chlororaphis]